MTAGNQDGPQQEHGGQGGNGSVQCLPMGPTVHGNGVHHAASENRHEQIGNGRYHHRAGDAGYQPGLSSPMAKEKGQYVTHYVLTTSGNTHSSLTRTTG